MNFSIFKIKDTLTAYFTFAVLVFIVGFLLLPTSKMVNNTFYAFLAFPALIVISVRIKQLRAPSAIEWGWVALLAFCSIGGAVSGDWQYFKHILYVALFLLVVGLLVSPWLFRSACFSRGLFWVLLCYVLLSAIYYWISGRYAVGERVLWLPGRMTGPIYTSIWMACCTALVLPAWLRERRWLEMAAGLFFVVFCISYVLQSRSGLVGLFVLFALWGGWALAKNYRRVLEVFIVLALCALASWLAASVFPEISRLFARADSGRFELWSLLLGEWKQCGILMGCGVEYVSKATLRGGQPIQHPHNIYLALGLYNGLVALAAFLLVMSITLSRAWKQRDPWGLYLFTALVSLNFDGSQLIGNPDELWLLVLLPAALIANPHRVRPERDADVLI